MLELKNNEQKLIKKTTKSIKYEKRKNIFI